MSEPRKHYRSKRRATMLDVANLAGVSQASVSYVLNARKDVRISDDTRLRILEIANSLEYRPNAIAKAMASGNSGTIGIFQPHAPGAPLASVWSGSVMQGISEELHNREKNLLLYGFQRLDGPPAAAFLDGKIDALILLAPHIDDVLPKEFSYSGKPLGIICGVNIDAPNVFCADVDNVDGARKAVSQLIHWGHRDIVHFEGPEDVPNAIDRRSGFESQMREAGLPILEGSVMRAGFTRAGGYRCMKAALSRTNRPTAVFAANDVVALGALQACADAKVSVPEEMSIIGFDDTPECEFARPRISSMRQPASEMGKWVARSILNYLEGDTSLQQSKIFITNPIMRESAGPVPLGRG